MTKAILSFAPSAAVKNGKFVALVLKFRFSDADDLLTAWAIPQMQELFRALVEQVNYFANQNLALNSDSVEVVIRSNSPNISMSEIEDLPVAAVVTSVQAKHFQGLAPMSLKLCMGKNKEEMTLLLPPTHVEWLIGFMGNTLNEFDEGGLIFPPDGAIN